jgi:hypothetical protein
VISWNIRPEEVWPRIVQAQVDAIEADIVALVNSLTDDATEFMQANHRWQNRSGLAEGSLNAYLLHGVRQFVYLVLSHGSAVIVPYAWFLEYSFAGRFAVLGDAADTFWPVLYRGVIDILRRHSS